MAFFGLTQLGPQSTFNVNLISLQNYTCFSEDDFRASFDKHSGGAASIPLDKVGPMLEGVFGGFAPEQEMEALLAALQHFGGDISFDHVMTSVAAVAGGKAATAQGYDTSRLVHVEHGEPSENAREKSERLERSRSMSVREGAALRR